MDSRTKAVTTKGPEGKKRRSKSRKHLNLFSPHWILPKQCSYALYPMPLQALSREQAFREIRLPF